MKHFLFSLFVFSFISVFGQIEVSPDSAFGVNGRISIEVGLSSSGESGLGKRILKMLPDGKMLLGTTAKINAFNANRNYWISRTLSDGSPDNLFGENGQVIIFSGNDGTGNALVALDTDEQGAAYVFGERKDPFTVIEEAVVKKLLPDGSMDNTFGASGELVFRVSPIGSLTRARDLKMLDDGKILVLMDYRNSATNPVGLGVEYCVARFLANGVIDSSFAANGYSFIIDETLNDLASKMALQSDGKIILAGTVSISGVSKYRFIRLNENGTLDESFGDQGNTIIDRGGVSTINLNDLIIGSDDAIMATGNAGSMLTIVKLTANGDLDMSFSEDGILDIGQMDIGNKLLIASSEEVYAIGKEFDQVAIAKITPEGDLDFDFGNNGIANLGNANPSSIDLTAAFSNEGELFIAGKWINSSLDQYSILKVKFVDASQPSEINLVESNGLLVYPNPAADYIHINGINKPCNYRLINSAGSEIAKGELNKNGCIPTAGLSKGIYYLILPENGLSARISIVK